MVDFIGLGAQKAGTSWVYACLYEHPEICAPQKELHFFSRPRFDEKGIEWYEAQFAGCDSGKKRGEFSTSYLLDAATPERIATHYPDARLLAIIRHPIDRAYSQYKNAIKAGEVPKQMTFTTYLDQVPSCLEQGLYAKQLERYFRYFSSLQLLVLVYEDAKTDPLGFIKAIYTHLGVDPEFVPSFLKKYVNEERTPRFVFIDRLMHRLAEGLRKIGFDQVVWLIKKSGITDLIRKANTEAPPPVPKERIDEELLARLRDYYRRDTKILSGLVHRDMNVEWGIVPDHET